MEGRANDGRSHDKKRKRDSEPPHVPNNPDRLLKRVVPPMDPHLKFVLTESAIVAGTGVRPVLKLPAHESRTLFEWLVDCRG